MKKETLVKKLLSSFYGEWEKERANEVAEARGALIKIFKELNTSLPAAVFTCEIVKHELLRGQLEEFLGHVKLTKDLPLSTKTR